MLLSFLRSCRLMTPKTSRTVAPKSQGKTVTMPTCSVVRFADTFRYCGSHVVRKPMVQKLVNTPKAVMRKVPLKSALNMGTWVCVSNQEYVLLSGASVLFAFAFSVRE